MCAIELGASALFSARTTQAATKCLTLRLSVKPRHRIVGHVPRLQCEDDLEFACAMYVPSSTVDQLSDAIAARKAFEATGNMPSRGPG